MARSLDTKRRRLWTAALLLFFLACAEGEGCDQGCGDGGCGEGGCALGEVVPYPALGPVMHQSAQVRITQSGFGFLEENAGPLVGDLMGEDGLSFCLPGGSVIGYEYCQREVAGEPTCNGGAGCVMEPEIVDLELEPVAPDSPSGSTALNITIHMSVDMVMPLDNALGDCDIRLQTDDLPVSAQILLHVDDADPYHTSIEVGDEIAIDWSAISITSVTPDGLCPARAGLLMAGMALLGDLIAPFIVGPIQDAIEEPLCLACAGDDETCPDGASCSGDPRVCRYDGSPTDECVPLPLGIENELNLASMMATYAPSLRNSLSYLVYAAGYADAIESGLSLGVQIGLVASNDGSVAWDVCVPQLDGPTATTIPLSTEMNGNLSPSGTSYMAGVGVAEEALEMGLWAFHQSGGLCISVGGDTIEQLTSSTFAIVLESLPDHTEGQNVPMLMRLRPRQAPVVEIGANQVLEGSPPVINDPALTVILRELIVDFYAFSEERFVRLFSLDTTVELPIALAPSDDGYGVQVLIGDLDSAFTRIVPIDAEMMAASDVENLAEVLPSLLAAFVPQLLTVLEDPFEIPAFGGFRLVIEEQSVTGIEDNTMLGIFANLEPDTSETVPAATTIPTAAVRIVDVIGPTPQDVARFEAQRRRDGIIDIETLRTEVLVEVETIGADSREREYSYRIDGGSWHMYQTGPEIWITDAIFFIEGYHTIEVRSRVPNERNTLSLISTPVQFEIDLSSPNVSLRRLNDDEIEVLAYDSVTPEDVLAMRYRLDNGDWSERLQVNPIRLPSPSESDASVVLLEVEVTDDAGHSSLTHQTFALRGSPSVPDTPQQEELIEPTGCQVGSGHGGGRNIALFLGVFLLLIFRARVNIRRHTVGAKVAKAGRFFTILCVLLLVSACSDDPAVGPTNGGGTDVGPETGTGCGDGCLDGQICVDDFCVDNVCSIDDDCPEDMACVDGTCVLRTRCTEDSECDDGLFCIDDDGDGGSECLPAPCSGDGDCSFISCGNGQRPFCIDGNCLCQLPCSEGCGDDQYCCYTSNSCVDLPLECAPLVCDAGFGPAIVNPATGDSDTCAVTGPECECQELPPLPMGDIGAFLSADVTSDGTIYVSAFNRTYEDLMLGSVGADDTIEWTFLDGVPTTGAITGGLSGPRGGIADGGDRVGRYTSMAISDTNVIHIAYFDQTNRALNYAIGTPAGGVYTWALSIIDEETDYSGYYTSVSLSSTGVPAVTYLVQRAESALGVWQSEVRVAWADAATPTTWTIETVTATPLTAPCGGDCPSSMRCHVETNRCERTTRSSSCEPACGSGQSCFESLDGLVCGTVAGGSTMAFLIEGSGLFIDTDRFDTDDLAVVFYDRNLGAVRYTRSTGLTFAGAVVEVVDGIGADCLDAEVDPAVFRDVGWYPAVTVGPDQTVHITYHHANEGSLRYFEVGNDCPQIVDTGVRGMATESERIVVGYDSSVTVLADGTLQVVYMDATYHQVMSSTRAADSAVWTVPSVRLGNELPYEGAFGFYVEQVSSGGSTSVVSYRINTQEAVRDVAVGTVP